MDLILDEVSKRLAMGETLLLVTVIEVGSKDLLSEKMPRVKIGNKRLILQDGTAVGTLGDELLDRAADIEAHFQADRPANETIALNTKRFQAPENQDFTSNTELRLLFEVLRPQPCLLICGAGHIARALVDLGLTVGFRAVVIDDRPEFASRQFFPNQSVELEVGAFEEVVDRVEVTPNTAVVIVTRGHKHDEDCLRKLLSRPAGYIGMIGSRRRVNVVFEKLQSEGFSQKQIEQIYAPIGLDIGARTPEEIALAILAEIILIRNRGRGYNESFPLSTKTRR